MQTLLDKTKLEQLHETDEMEWIYENMRLIEEGRIEEVDWKNIHLELEIMARTEKRSVISRLSVLLTHLLKWIFQKGKRTNSWIATINVQRNELSDIFDDSKVLLNHGKENFEKIYQRSRNNASTETGLPLKNFPEEPPFTFEKALDKDYFPD